MDLTDLTDLTPAERRVRHAFPLGEGVDFREGDDDDPGRGADWGPERTLRAPSSCGSCCRPGRWRRAVRRA
nr:hypothetical protein [Streptomyces lavendulae]